MQHTVEVAALLVFSTGGVDRQSHLDLAGAQRLVGHCEVLEGADGHALEALVGQLLVEFACLALLETADLDADALARQVLGLADLQRVALGGADADGLVFVGQHLHELGALLGVEDAGVDDVPAAGLQAGDHG
ncbi:hypothetical protein D9M72_524960 [compost metagenome]